MDVVVHLGTHKTGTTALQAALAARLPTPEAAAGQVAFLGPSPPSRNPAWLAERARDAEAAGARRLIVSNEAYSLKSARALREVRDAFGGRKTRAIVVFRHWSGYLPSRWIQS